MLACARIAGLDQGGSGSGSDGERSDGGSVTTPEGALITPAGFTITAGCQAQGTSDNPLKIRNSSAQPMPYRVEVDDTTTLSLSRADGATGTMLEGEIPANDSSPEIRVISAPGVAGAAKKSITVTTGASTQVLPVDVGVSGGDVRLSTSLIDFGPVRKNEASTQKITIANDGSEPVTITGWGSAPATVLFEPSTITIPARGEQPVNITYRASGTENVDVSVTPTTSAKLCAVAPGLQVRGSPVDAIMTVNPGSIDFGQVRCNDGQKSANLMIKNYSSGPLVETLGTPETPFTLMPVGAINVGTTPANVTLLLDTKRPAGTYTSTVQATNPSDPAQQLTFKARLVGADVVVSATSVTFGPGNRNKTITVSASGGDIGFKVIVTSPKNEYSAYFLGGGGSRSDVTVLSIFNPQDTLHIDAKNDSPDDATLTFQPYPALLYDRFCVDAPVVQLRK